ncbi:MAG: hypothetical protein ACLTK8_00145 [Paeniclostridium sp.]
MGKKNKVITDITYFEDQDIWQKVILKNEKYKKMNKDGKKFP